MKTQYQRVGFFYIINTNIKHDHIAAGVKKVGLVICNLPY